VIAAHAVQRDHVERPAATSIRPQEGIVIEDTFRTINVWLAITAVVTMVEVLLAIAIVIGGYLVYRRVMVVVGELERRQVAPLVSRVSGILDDVNVVTARVRERAKRVDRAMFSAVGIVDHTRRRAEVNLGATVRGVASVLIGALTAFEAVLRIRNENATGARPLT
jgi:hypothetical protein